MQAWRQGRTGYPLVDAGMRQLWSTGWLHNRIRVVCASFLVKNLLLPWQWGLKHYWDALLDADLECAALGWQYVSGCLAGAGPRATAQLSLVPLLWLSSCHLAAPRLRPYGGSTPCLVKHHAKHAMLRGKWVDRHGHITYKRIRQLSHPHSSLCVRRK